MRASSSDHACAAGLRPGPEGLRCGLHCAAVCVSRRPWSRRSASGSQGVLPRPALDHRPETTSLSLCDTTGVSACVVVWQRRPGVPGQPARAGFWAVLWVPWAGGSLTRHSGSSPGRLAGPGIPSSTDLSACSAPPPPQSKALKPRAPSCSVRLTGLPKACQG